MKSNLLKLPTLLLSAAVLAGCGGGQDAEDNAASADAAAPSYSVPTPAVRTEESVDESTDEATAAMSDQSSTASGPSAAMEGDAVEGAEPMNGNAGDEVASTSSDEADGTATAGGDAASNADAGDPCNVRVGVGDSIAYSIDSISVPSSCQSVTIELEHTGSLPKEAMGHNWVLVPADAVDAIGQAAMEAGLQSGYLPDDERIVAATDLIGGGENTSVTFSLDALEDGVDYTYVCTFPGHWMAMRGSFTVE